MKKTVKLLLALVLIIVTVSCSRTEADISDVLAYPYVKGDRMGLSVWLMAKVPSEEGLSLALTSPDETLSWKTAASKEKFDSLIYFGCADFAMPEGCDLPKGTWKIELICKDGQVCESFFTVDYSEETITRI